jgi:predicted RNase H-like nuclease (RuvC/YqgF family)
MRPLGNKFIGMIGLAISMAALSYGQSLGDVAREQRQKEAAKKAQTTPKVVTNDDLPEHPDADQSSSSSEQNSESAASSTDKKSAEQWKAEIEAQKKSVANLQADIDRLNSSIHFAPGNCVRNCVQYNEHQVQKQDEVQQMQSQLEEQKKKLEDMQEGARKEGYGNSVYEP